MFLHASGPRRTSCQGHCSVITSRKRRLANGVWEASLAALLNFLTREMGKGIVGGMLTYPFIYINLFVYLIYLKDKQRSSIYRFTPQIPILARADQSQEPGTWVTLGQST